uniref:SFRICE_039372 n=1 Tax=Spodoptera frugiperda TaxID=7108 RepID=A0A2H1WFJ0_SPOFR
MFKVTFPTTNTCPNTLPYLYDGHSWTEYASNFFWRRISIHGLFRLYKQGTLCKNQPVLGSDHCPCHVVK